MTSSHNGLGPPLFPNFVAILHRIERASPPVDGEPDYQFFCPGCNEHHGVWCHPPNRMMWKFNGNMERPTFEPSIRIDRDTWDPPVTPENIEQWRAAPWEQRKVHFCCHVVVTGGILNFCGDCTHSLAGKSVAMVDLDRADP